MKEKIIGTMSYNETNDRYGVKKNGEWIEDGFHCGECMEIMVDGQWIQSRIEMKFTETERGWYLVDTPFFGNLENIQVRIEKYI